MKFITLAFIGLPIAMSALAQPTSDLELQIVIDAPSVTPPGSTGEVSFIITNHGPDATGPPGDFNILLGGGPLPITLADGELLDYTQLSGLAECRIIAQVGVPPPNEPPQVFHTGYIANLPAGSSRTCTTRIDVNPRAFEMDPEGTADGDIDHRWTAYINPGEDPDSSNNRVEVAYYLTATAVPALNPTGISLLIVGIIFAYFLILRRKHDA